MGSNPHPHRQHIPSASVKSTDKTKSFTFPPLPPVAMPLDFWPDALALPKTQIRARRINAVAVAIFIVSPDHAFITSGEMLRVRDKPPRSQSQQFRKDRSGRPPTQAASDQSELLGTPLIDSSFPVLVSFKFFLLHVLSVEYFWVF